MAQKRKPPRLYLRQRRGGDPKWVIRDGGRMIATGFPERERDSAIAFLKEYAGMHPFDTEPPPKVKKRALDVEGLIYFITCELPDFPIKVGWSSDFKVRLSGLQMGLPYKLKVLLTMEGSLEYEQSLHIAFNEYRMEGEWFRRGQKLMDFIHIRRLDQRGVL